MYTKEVLEHFKNPKNVGEIKNADGIGEAGNRICGDIMWLYIKVGKNERDEEFLEDVKFKTLGCVAAIASSSKATELAKGLTIEEALKLSKDDIVKSLGGLPPTKIHCSVLAIDALREAIYNYLKKNGKSIPEWLEKEHERIKKEKKFVEEKYKEFVEMQKKILKGG